MINKLHFGKRIAALRRREGLSQTELAERLGVTSQAVSKWECGNALPDIELLLELSHLYHVSVNEMLEDVDILFGLTGQRTGSQGIAYFVPQEEREYNAAWADEIRRGGWIRRNWEHAQAAHSVLDEVGAEIARRGGGIGNCEGDKAQALKEAYRVLKPGGTLVTSTGFVNKETLALLPQSAQKVLLAERPDIFEDLYEDTVLAGFDRIDSAISGCWFTDDDDSTIADLARSLGVNLKFTSYVRYCTKG